MFAYLPQSSLSFPEQHALADLLREAGFVETRVHEWVFGASVLHLARR